MKVIQSFVAVLAMVDFVASFRNANEDHMHTRRSLSLKRPPHAKPEVVDLPKPDIVPDAPQADQPKVYAVPIETSATKMPKKAKVTSAPQGTVKTPKLKRSKAPKGKTTKAKTPKGKVVPKAKTPKGKVVPKAPKNPKNPKNPEPEPEPQFTLTATVELNFTIGINTDQLTSQDAIDNAAQVIEAGAQQFVPEGSNFNVLSIGNNTVSSSRRLAISEVAVQSEITFQTSCVDDCSGETSNVQELTNGTTANLAQAVTNGGLVEAIVQIVTQGNNATQAVFENASVNPDSFSQGNTETIANTPAPTNVPSMVPSVNPSASPSTVPSMVPSTTPSTGPSGSPSESPSTVPSASPSTAPSTTPSAGPSGSPSVLPSNKPSASPGNTPSMVPSTTPSAGPSVSPSESPSMVPSSTPSAGPSGSPSESPSNVPTASPSNRPSVVASTTPSAGPSVSPSESPTTVPTASPSAGPSGSPSESPSTVPSASPSNVPSMVPSTTPSAGPSGSPSESPSTVPTASPSNVPSMVPSTTPSAGQSGSPSESPSTVPTASPSNVPSMVPSMTPSAGPSVSPSESPSMVPSMTPSVGPSVSSSESPSIVPSASPSNVPSMVPSSTPSAPLCPDNNTFEITLMNMGSNTDYDAVFASAKARWESIIKCDLSDQPARSDDWFGGQFAGKSYSGAVDDVVIGYEFKYIDGTSNTLGFAGARFIRGDTRSPISGIMVFDEDDFASMPSENAEIIILHEMGHVLGLVNLSYTLCYSPCTTSSDYGWNSGCTGASTEYDALGLGGSLLVDTASCGHWDESSFPYGTTGSSELMTPYFESNQGQPLSRVTIAALGESTSDYVVDYSSANSYPLTAGGSNEQFKVLRPASSFSLAGRMIPLDDPIEVFD